MRKRKLIVDRFEVWVTGLFVGDHDFGNYSETVIERNLGLSGNQSRWPIRALVKQSVGAKKEPLSTPSG